MQMATWNGTDLSSLSDIGSLESAPAKRPDGSRGLQRPSRRANGGILKSIRRKLPWNRRPREEASSHDFSEDSDSAFGSTTSVGKGGGKQPKTKTRASGAAVCPVQSTLRMFGEATDGAGPQEGLYLCRCSDAEAPARDPRGSSSVPGGDSYQELSGAEPAEDNYRELPGVERPAPGEEEEEEEQLCGLPAPRGLTAELCRLSRCGWYWGPVTRCEAEEKLRGQPDGAFLLRDSSDDRYLLSLSFRSFGKTLHTRIEHCNGVFSFYLSPASEGFGSPVDLIEHSMSYSRSGIFCYSRARTAGAPSLPVRLTQPVSRFSQVRSLQYLCRCVIRQHTRVDHIQRLPLPSRIIGYIQARLH